jgi:hypothetical protein
MVCLTVAIACNLKPLDSGPKVLLFYIEEKGRILRGIRPIWRGVSKRVEDGTRSPTLRMGHPKTAVRSARREWKGRAWWARLKLKRVRGFLYDYSDLQGTM